MTRFKYFFGISLFHVLINKCVAVIYHLNDTEYKRMPPLFALDAYEPCLRANNGMYCMMELDLHPGHNEQLITIIKDYSEHTVKHYNHTYIQRGVCIQKTCHDFIGNRSLNNLVVRRRVLEECLNNSIWNEYGLEARLRLLNYCDNNDDVSHTDISNWIVAGIFAAIVLTNLLGTIYHVLLERKKRSNGNQYLLSFSVQQNWRFLTTAKPLDPKLDRLTGLHGYRTIKIFLMIIAHVIWINSNGFTENPHDFEKAYENIIYQLIFNGMMIIQIFLVQSGFLLAYNLLIRSEKQTVTWKMYPQLLFMRWWRLTPPYAVTLAFTATWLRHLASGPLWRLWVTNSVVSDCRTYWWLHLLYIHNYVSADKFCAIQSWYLGAELQVFVVSSFLFLLSTPRMRGPVLSLLLIFGTIIPALHVWLRDLDGVMIMDPEFYRKKISDTFDVHILGHNYFSSYAIGMGTACIAYQLQNQGKDRRKSKILQVLSWCFFPAMLCLFLTGRGFYADVPRAAPVIRVVWTAGHRLIMSGIAGFAILSIVMRFSESTCAVLEWPGWAVSGRLCYCVYLVHINFIHVFMGTRTSLTQVSFYNMIIVYLGVTLMSFAAAFPLYLLVEAPAACLMKRVTRVKPAYDRSSPSANRLIDELYFTTCMLNQVPPTLSWNFVFIHDFRYSIQLFTILVKTVYYAQLTFINAFETLPVKLYPCSEYACL